MVIIRRAAKRDYAEIVEIMNKSASSEELEGFLPPVEVSQNFLLKRKDQLELSEHGVLIAELNLKPVGFVFFTQESDCLEIEEIDVLRECQRKGIGRALIDQVENIARDRRAVTLITGTSINSEGVLWKAYGFWIRMGFQDTGERTDSGYGFKYCKLVKIL